MRTPSWRVHALIGYKGQEVELSWSPFILSVLQTSNHSLVWLWLKKKKIVRTQQQGSRYAGPFPPPNFDDLTLHFPGNGHCSSRHPWPNSSLWPSRGESWSMWNGRKYRDHHIIPFILQVRKLRPRESNLFKIIQSFSLSAQRWFLFLIKPYSSFESHRQPVHLSQSEYQIYLLIHASRDWFPETLSASPRIFFQFVINTDNGLHMASMFASLCEFHGSCIVYQFNMSKTAASSSGKSARPFLQSSTPAIPTSHPLQQQASQQCPRHWIDTCQRVKLENVREFLLY